MNHINSSSSESSFLARFTHSSLYQVLGLQKDFDQGPPVVGNGKFTTTAAAQPSTTADKTSNAGAEHGSVLRKIRNTLQRGCFACAADAAEDELIDRFQFFFLHEPRVIFCTVSVGGRASFDTITFSAVVIDEAGMVPEAESMIVLRDSVQRVVLVGDPKQLTATVFSEANRAANYGRSLMARLMERCNFPAHMLLVEYRMGQALSAWPNQKFYEGKLLGSDEVRKRALIPIFACRQNLYHAGSIGDFRELTKNLRRQKKPAEGDGNPFSEQSWCDTQGLSHATETKTVTWSFLNNREAELVIELIKRLAILLQMQNEVAQQQAAGAGSGGAAGIVYGADGATAGGGAAGPKGRRLHELVKTWVFGITSPYSGQVAHLKEMARKNLGIAVAEKIKISTIDSFQVRWNFFHGLSVLESF